IRHISIKIGQSMVNNGLPNAGHMIQIMILGFVFRLFQYIFQQLDVIITSLPQYLVIVFMVYILITVVIEYAHIAERGDMLYESSTIVQASRYFSAIFSGLQLYGSKK